MSKKTRFVVYAAVLAALYVVLTHLQNLVIPGSATWAIQFRASEALCVMALFTPAAVPGLTVGCFLFNITYAQTLPLDVLVGSLATLLACLTMRLTRGITVRQYPWLAMLMPALFNALLVGWELSVYIGGGTPTILNADQLDFLLDTITKNLISVREFTLEAGRPDTITPDKLKTAAKAAREFIVRRKGAFAAAAAVGASACIFYIVSAPAFVGASSAPP